MRLETSKAAMAVLLAVVNDKRALLLLAINQGGRKATAGGRIKFLATEGIKRADIYLQHTMIARISLLNSPNFSVWPEAVDSIFKLYLQSGSFKSLKLNRTCGVSNCSER